MAGRRVTRAAVTGAALVAAVSTARIEAISTGTEQALGVDTRAEAAATDTSGTTLQLTDGLLAPKVLDRSDLPPPPGSPTATTTTSTTSSATLAPTTTVEPTTTTSTRTSATTGSPLTVPTTSAAAATTAAGPSSPEARGRAALASISYPWQTHLAGWQIRFHHGIDGAYGYTLTDESIIDIYVRDNQSEQLLAHVIAHEIGHAVDVTRNDGDDRERWREARGIASAPWWPDNKASDFSTGAGDFAESFAAWQVGVASFRSNLGGPPSHAQLDLIAELATN